MQQKPVLITGASGFLGGHLVRHLDTQGRSLRLAGRALEPISGLNNVSSFLHGDLDGTTDWRPALDAIDSLVHCAGFAHASADKHSARLHHQINFEASVNLARQAAAAGVRRFIYISSIKVNGERSLPGKPFAAKDIPHPEGAYAKAKYQAEQALLELAQCSTMEVVILRPCLIYGPGVKANFLQLLKAVAAGVPLPLASINNLRSYISVENLVDLIAICLVHPAAANQVFLASDGKDFSTPDLLRCLAHAMGRSARLMPCSLSLLKLIAALSGQKQRLDRLTSWLQLDMCKTCELLAWQPPYKADDCLAGTVKAFLGVATE